MDQHGFSFAGEKQNSSVTLSEHLVYLPQSLSTGFAHNTATVLLAVQSTAFENIYEHINKVSCEISKYFISNHLNGR